MIKEIGQVNGETVLWLVLAASFALTVYVWFRLFRLNEHLALKFLIGVVALIPIIGPLMGLWIAAMPDRLPRKLQATMNHWERGGRFIGFGSGRFTYGDMSEEGKDWNPTVPDILEEEKKSKGKNQ